jgi:hypothetical protein
MRSLFIGRFVVTVVMVLMISVRVGAQNIIEPAAPVKTAGQVQKNIQALKDLPASQLDMVMDLIAASLGVRCGYCHTQDSSGWHFEKDDKIEKKKARKMIQMVMDVNTRAFGGRTAVTCYTCHHGSTEPVEVIPLSQTPAMPHREEPAVTRDYPPVDLVIAKCEKAFGGADAIGKIKSRVTKGKTVDPQGHESPQEISQLGPDQYLAVTTVRDGVQRMMGFDGATGWMSSPRGTREMSAEQTEELQEQAALFPIQHLRDLKKVMHVHDLDTANGVGVYVLAAKLIRGAEENFYVDTASGLLVRKVVITDTPIGLIPERVDYSDYRPVDGVMVPYVVTTTAVDPHDGSTFRVTSVEQNVSLNQKLFLMPESKK